MGIGRSGFSKRYWYGRVVRNMIRVEEDDKASERARRIKMTTTSGSRRKQFVS